MQLYCTVYIHYCQRKLCAAHNYIMYMLLFCNRTYHGCNFIFHTSLYISTHATANKRSNGMLSLLIRNNYLYIFLGNRCCCNNVYPSSDERSITRFDMLCSSTDCTISNKFKTGTVATEHNASYILCADIHGIIIISAACLL